MRITTLHRASVGLCFLSLGACTPTIKWQPMPRHVFVADASASFKLDGLGTGRSLELPKDLKPSMQQSRTRSVRSADSGRAEGSLSASAMTIGCATVASTASNRKSSTDKPYRILDCYDTLGREIDPAGFGLDAKALNQ